MLGPVCISSLGHQSVHGGRKEGRKGGGSVFQVSTHYPATQAVSLTPRAVRRVIALIRPPPPPPTRAPQSGFKQQQTEDLSDSNLSILTTISVLT